MEKEFKDYKEKQAYYKQRAKQCTMTWVSKEHDIKGKKNNIIKGRTYVKPKENKNEKN